MGRFLKWVTFLGLAIALLVASGVVDVRVSVRDRVAGAIELFGDKDQPPAEAAEPFWKEGGAERPAAPPVGAPGSFADLAERVSPAVVNIQTKKTLAAGGARHPLEELFPQFQIPRELREMPSLGTGFVISADGYIATNNHVIEDVDKIEVHFLTGEKLEAEIVGPRPEHRRGADPGEARASRSRSCRSATRTRVRPGDWVVADRQSVRPRAHGDGRHRLGEAPRDQRSHLDAAPLRRLHPDRRGHQPGQLGRAAHQPRRAR